jgi:ubiquinone biosynthesis protein COQ9
LAGVYTSTELFMLTDASDNFADTWAFLDRRLEDVVTLSKYKAEVYLMPPNFSVFSVCG